MVRCGDACRRARAGLILVAGVASGAPAQQGGQGPLDPKAFLRAVIKAHHGPAQGGFEHAMLTLTPVEEGGKKGKPTLIAVSLPDRMRVNPPLVKLEPDAKPTRIVELLVKEKALRCKRGQEPTPLAGKELQRLVDLRHHMTAITLTPLYRADKVRRAGPNVYALVLPGGQTWRLEVDEQDKRVIELRGPAGAVRFLTFKDTGVTKIPKLVELPGLGQRQVDFQVTGLSFKDKAFENPFAKSTGGKKRVVSGTSFNEKPDRPEVQTLPRRRYLVFDDPGTWKKRRELLVAASKALRKRGELHDGLPLYSLEKGRTVLLVPTRLPDGKGKQGKKSRPSAAPAVKPPKMPKVLIESSHRAVVVAPPEGTWDASIARGRAMITEYLKLRRLEAVGPMRVVPFLLPTAVPKPAELRKLRVRIEVGLEKPTLERGKN